MLRAENLAWGLSPGSYLRFIVYTGVQAWGGWA